MVPKEEEIEEQKEDIKEDVSKLDEHRPGKHIHVYHGTHTCYLCNLTFTDHNLFRMHMRTTHLTNGIYHCQMCTENFPRAQVDEYVYHLTESHHIGDYR